MFYNYDGGLDYVDDLSCDDVDDDNMVMMSTASRSRLIEAHCQLLD